MFSAGRFLLLLLFLCSLHGCGDRAPQSATDFVVTSSYLECALNDVLGKQAACLRLAEPGTCPGHFDMRPSQLQAIRGARLLLRLDFQGSLDRKLADLPGSDLKIVAVHIDGGMCEPASYMQACKQVADALVDCDFLSAEAAEERLTQIEQRLAERQADWLKQVEPLHGTHIVTSTHQERFCRWLGLEVVGTFSAMDSARVGEVNDTIVAGDREGVELVIANHPEGRTAADALAHRLDATVCVFSNFPLMRDGQDTFDAMIRDNITALSKVSQP